MPQAQITINAVVGSDNDLPINTLVQLDNNNIGGEVSFLWAILDQPAGPADILSNTAIQNPTFTPRKEGTYLIRLIVNQGLGDEQTDTVDAGILLLKTRKRVPAAGEQTEASVSRGWAGDTNNLIRFLNDKVSDPGTIVGVNGDASPMVRGAVVRATSSVTLKAGLPGEEEVPGFTPALATTGTQLDELLLVAEGDIDGASPIPVGGLGVFRYVGRFSDLALGAGAVGDPVFVSDTGTISVTQGTNRRQVGSIMAVDGVNRDIWFAGTQGGDNAPVDVAYVVYGSPGALPNAVRIDGLNATGAVGNVPYTFRGGDVTTIPLVAKKFSNLASADLFQIQDEAGTSLTGFEANGRMVFEAAGTAEIVFDDSGLFDDVIRYNRTNDKWEFVESGITGLEIGTGGAQSSSAPSIRFDTTPFAAFAFERSNNQFEFSYNNNLLKLGTSPSGDASIVFDDSTGVTEIYYDIGGDELIFRVFGNAAEVVFNQTEIIRRTQQTYHQGPHGFTPGGTTAQVFIPVGFAKERLDNNTAGAVEYQTNLVIPANGTLDEVSAVVQQSVANTLTLEILERPIAGTPVASLGTATTTSTSVVTLTVGSIAHSIVSDSTYIVRLNVIGGTNDCDVFNIRARVTDPTIDNWKH